MITGKIPLDIRIYLPYHVFTNFGNHTKCSVLLYYANSTVFYSDYSKPSYISLQNRISINKHNILIRNTPFYDLSTKPLRHYNIQFTS